MSEVMWILSGIVGTFVVVGILSCLIEYLDRPPDSSVAFTWWWFKSRGYRRYKPIRK